MKGTRLIIARLLNCLAMLSVVPYVAQAGIADQYDRDQGIAHDPAVIFREDFEGALPAILAQFAGHQPGAFVQSSDRPTESGGTKALRISPQGSGGTLFKLLPDDYNQLYFRYYIKYVDRDYHHSGGYIGGYWPRSARPLGDAGIKGVRNDGARLISVGFETQGGKDETVPDTRLDTYMNWVGMGGQEIGGGWWGRNLVQDLKIPIRPQVWQCIELMLKMNSTSTSHDGEFAIWIDGALKAYFRQGAPNGQFNAYSGNWIANHSGTPFDGFQWRDILDYGINWIKVQNYDPSGAPTDILIDDLVVATDYIGPLKRFKKEGVRGVTSEDGK